MRRRIPVWRLLRMIVPLLILGIAGCEPGEPTSPEATEFVAPQLAAVVVSKKAVPGGTDPIVAELRRLVPGLPLRATKLGECKTRIRIPKSARNAAFRASRITLTFAPEMIEAAGGRTTNYRFWRVVQDDNGPTLLRFADCLIPRTRAAIDQTWAWFTQPVGSKKQASALGVIGNHSTLVELLAILARYLGPQKLFAVQDECGIEFPEGCYVLDGIVVSGCPSGETFDTGQGKCLPTGSPPPPPPGGDPPPPDGAETCPTFETCPDPGSGGGPPGGTAPPPGNEILGPFTLSCDAVVRGGTGSCQVTPPEGAGSWTATFEWIGLGSPSTHEGTSWGGTMVASGIMRATVHHNLEDITLESVQWQVGNRSQSSFGWVISVTLSKTGGPPHPQGAAWPGSGAVVWGWVCSTVRGCVTGGVAPLVHPDWTDGGGATITQITSGPNKGVYYVSSAGYGMNLGIGYNVNTQPAGPKLTISYTDDIASCTGNVTPESSGSIKVNTYTYNTLCRSTQATGWPEMLVGLIAHEENHIDNIAAVKASIDPRIAIEAFVDTDQEILKADIETEVAVANQQIVGEANKTHAAPLWPWFTVTGWFWNATLVRFTGPTSFTN